MINESKNDLKKVLLHSRNVYSNGYLRYDGFFEIEGTIVDKKSYDIPKSDGTVLRAGEPLHKMIVKLTLDIFIKNLKLFISKKPLENQVDKKLGY